ncbi:LacI family DNA-binding transcriptional regulator [Bradyrhizobium sp.]|uniref:LacI family DNA-binding transcriptional regulator n=1 Tax=Bradyrhizobium sp. TaxID=376 RepID=UPI0039E49B48
MPRRGAGSERAGSRPTQKDIALAAGVSQAAVSLVLNKSETPSVPEATRARILKLAGEMGYQPHHPARMLRRARTMAIACVVPDITNPFYPGLVRGVQSVAAPAGYDVLMFDTDGREDGEARALNWLLQGRADGVVGTFFHLRVPELAALARQSVPIVRLESRHKAGGDVPVDSVYIDNAEASAAMTRYLIERGHRRISMILAQVGPSRQRELGYAAVMKDAGLTVDVVTDSRYSEESGARAMTEILARGRSRPTAVFGANDMLAVGAMVCARSAGLSVPGDVAIAGFDDIPAAKLLGLTTVRQPEFDLGALAARTLVGRLQPGGLKPLGQSLELKFEIMKRSSA